MFDQAKFTEGKVCPVCGYVVSLVHYSKTDWAIECMRSDGVDENENRECEFIVWGRTPEETLDNFLGVPNAK